MSYVIYEMSFLFMCPVFSKEPGKDSALNKGLWNITEQFTDSVIDILLGDLIIHVASSFNLCNIHISIFIGEIPLTLNSNNQLCIGHVRPNAP